MTANSEASTVELVHISKYFSGVRALEDVSLQASAGKCLGLVGENGAGKSTLMKILSGVWPAGSFQGEIRINGVSKEFVGPKNALDAGISIIHQELSLFEELSIAENIFMRDLPSRHGVVSRAALDEQAAKILERLQVTLDPQEYVRNLSVGEKQLVEIARAFSKPLKVLILDEPTSALTDQEILSLYRLVDEIKRQGVACIYISHKLDEIERLCEQVTVLRDGQTVAHFSSVERTTENIIEAMVGRKIENVFPPKRPFDPNRKTLLEVRNLSFKQKHSTQSLLKNVSFDVKEGEIFGISGLMGSRRTELLLALFGSLQGERISGEIFLEGKPISPSSPEEAIQCGFGLVTEDRKVSGLLLDRSVKENLSLPILRHLSKFLKIKEKQEVDLVEYYSKILRIKTPSLDTLIRNLSGGNQQKVIIGRWLSSKPKILLLDEPTRGIDVMAKAEIYFLMRELVDQGLTLILVSSELPEVVSLSDRVLIMRAGSVAGILDRDQISQKQIMEKAVA